MSYLCKSCAKEEALQNLAYAGDQPRVCVLCEQCSDSHIDLENRRVREVLRSLLRYHFDELEYNSHFGGDSIDELLARPNPIIDHSNPEGVEALCGVAFVSGYENSETGVSLFAGHAEGEQLPLLDSLQRSRDPFLRRVRKRLKVENHFDLKPAMRSRLEPHRSRVARHLSSSRFFRARIGIHKRVWEPETLQIAYVPHSGSLILAPPPPIASAGRINRAGVSFLYVASSAATAVAEIRPHPGHLVSTGQVQQIAPCFTAPARTCSSTAIELPVSKHRRRRAATVTCAINVSIIPIAHLSVNSQSSSIQTDLHRGVAPAGATMQRNACVWKFDTPLGREIYSRRMGTVEPVFGNLQNKGMRRFTLRGQKKVSAQWKLFTMVHNIEKVAGVAMR